MACRDRSGAFKCDTTMGAMTPQSATQRQLIEWFSAPRMKRFLDHPDPAALYLWNTRVSKAFLEDIQHAEVLLRNHIDIALSAKYGPEWFDSPKIPFTSQSKNAITKAQRRTNFNKNRNTGKVIAELNFDFWRYLLTTTYQTTIWPCLHSTFSSRVSRKDFEAQVQIIYTFETGQPTMNPSLGTAAAWKRRNWTTYQQHFTKFVPGSPRKRPPGYSNSQEFEC